ncbi:MAG: hypothetical protein LBE24_02940 [Methylobacillus sp.]|jgi:hypothetical protein|nr:hypothetical protein [Methylobacillus sp.]
MLRKPADFLIAALSMTIVLVMALLIVFGVVAWLYGMASLVAHFFGWAAGALAAGISLCLLYCLWRFPKERLKIKNPVDGTLIFLEPEWKPDPEGGTTVYSHEKIRGILSAPGIPAHEVHVNKFIEVSKWPDLKQVLPVTVDLDDFSRFNIEWDAIPEAEHVDPNWVQIWPKKEPE